MLYAADLARHICLLSVAVICVYTDLARGKLYNIVTLGGLAIGLALACVLDVGTPGFHHLASAALSAALGGGVFFLLYLAGGFDAGDVKLMAAVGALGGSLDFLIRALVCTALVGAAIAVGILIWRGRLLQGLRDSIRALVTFRKAQRDRTTSATMPYGLAIGIGTLWAWMEMVL